MAEPEIGVIYNGKVVKTADFGAFVNFLGAKDGLVHISELRTSRVNKTTDVVNVGDQVKVKVLGFDDRGKVKLSMRVVDQATGADITEQVGASRPREREKAAATARRDAASAATVGDREPAPAATPPSKAEPVPAGALERGAGRPESLANIRIWRG